MAAAAEVDVGLLGLGRHWVGDVGYEGLVLGFGRIPEHGFGNAIERLGSFLARS